MHTKLVKFIGALRDHDVRISTAESLDAMRVLALVGYEDRQRLKIALSTALAKTLEEKQRFNHCFELFYRNTSQVEDDNAESASSPEATASASEITAPFDLEAEITADPKLQQVLDSTLLEALVSKDTAVLETMIAQASMGLNLSKLRHFTQTAHFTRRLLQQLGQDQIDVASKTLDAYNTPVAAHLAYLLRSRKSLLRQMAKQAIEEQFLLTANAEGRKLQESVLLAARLSSLEGKHFHELQALVRKLAKKLAARHSKRQYVETRGKLDVAKTLRKNIHLDGILFETYWKKKRKDQPKLIALCDVSNSVAAYTRFLLLFLYSLSDVLPRVRSFCFSNCAGEVSDLFERLEAADAIEQAFELWGRGGSDYGRSLQDFATSCLDKIDNNTTIIILGDGRNNHGDPRLDILQSIYNRAKTVIWLNPERKSAWGTGDSEMNRYQSACHFSEECQSLQQLERIIDRLLKLIR